MSKLKYNVYFKVGAIVIIGLLLLIPASMIQGLIYDRENVQRDAIAEVTDKWSREQQIAGPILSIPYNKYVKQVDQNTGIEKTVLVKEYIHILPSSLNITGSVSPEKRHRGIYEVVVYGSKTKLSGSFDLSLLSQIDVAKTSLKFDQAKLNVGINDLRGIEEEVQLKWGNKSGLFFTSGHSTDILASGINAPVAVSSGDTSNVYDFEFSLNLKGSQYLYFTPVGKVTDVDMNSTWPNPSFNGAFLPDENKVSAQGFTAHWNILSLNRNYPQIWSGSQYSLIDSYFGVNLLLPVDSYQKAHRAINYAILFIGFTFIVFFFIEVLNKVFIHPIQYILVGISLVVFYTLLLSISEYLRFNYAFIVSAVATLLLIAGYVKAILKSNMLTLFIVGILFILYSFIFIVIQLQDYALLIGSIGIFLVLALVMYFSRKIDWYNLQLKDGEVS